MLAVLCMKFCTLLFFAQACRHWQPLSYQVLPQRQLRFAFVLWQVRAGLGHIHIPHGPHAWPPNTPLPIIHHDQTHPLHQHQDLLSAACPHALADSIVGNPPAPTPCEFQCWYDVTWDGLGWGWGPDTWAGQDGWAKKIRFWPKLLKFDLHLKICPKLLKCDPNLRICPKLLKFELNYWNLTYI